MPYFGNEPAKSAIKVGDNTVLSATIANGVIINEDIKSDAAIAMSKTALAAGTGITLATNTLNVDAAQTQITSVGTLTGFTSTGIDDNADQTVLTLDSNELVTFAGDITMSQAGQAVLHLNSSGDASEVKLTSNQGTWSMFSDNAADAFLINDGTTRFTLTDTSATFAGKVYMGGSVKGRSGVKMSASGVDWTDGNWSEVWNAANTPGNKYENQVFAIDTNRAGGVTGGIVGLSFSPGWTGHQNWGIYSLNNSGGGHTQGDLVFVSTINDGTLSECLRLKPDKSATFAGNITMPAGNAFFLDGGGDSKVEEFTANAVQVAAGGSSIVVDGRATGGSGNSRNVLLGVGTGTPKSHVDFYGKGGIGINSSDVILTNHIYFDASGNPKKSSGAAGSAVVLTGGTVMLMYNSTGNTDAAAAWNEGLRVTTAGNVGIGESDPSHKLVVKGDATTYVVRFVNDGNNANRHGLAIQAGADDGSGTTYYFNADDGDGTNVGYLATTSGTFALTDASDESLKENIRDR